MEMIDWCENVIGQNDIDCQFYNQRSSLIINWRYQAWGFKSISEAEGTFYFDNDNTRLEYEIELGNGSGIPLLHAMTAMFPELTFKAEGQSTESWYKMHFYKIENGIFSRYKHKIEAWNWQEEEWVLEHTNEMSVV